MNSPYQRPVNLNEELKTAVSSHNLKKVEQLVQKGANPDFRTSEGHPVLHLAIDCDSFPITKRLLELGAHPSATTRKLSQEGYTPLHLACLKGNHKLVELLITTYHVNPTFVAADGVQAIHLAMFKDNFYIVQLLLGASVNPETLIDKLMFEKYHKDVSWREDFGDSVTLLTFAVLYEKIQPARTLIQHGANLRVKNSNGRTLLMSAIYYRYFKIIRYLMPKLSKTEVNFQDIDGFTAAHYLFKPETFQYDEMLDAKEKVSDEIRLQILEVLVKRGADINLVARGDPATLLINIAAYLNDREILKFLLPRQKYSLIARPLFYATLPKSLGYPSSNLRLVRKEEPASTRYDSYRTVRVIVRDIQMRLTIGYPVNPEEFLRMKSLDQDFLESYDFQAVMDQLKKRTLTFDDKKMSVFQILSLTDNELKQLAEDKFFAEAFCDYQKKIYHDEETIAIMIKIRMIDQILLGVLKSEFKKLEFFSDTRFYCIPFYCTIEIVQYLDSLCLRKFINAYGPNDDALEKLFGIKNHFY